MNIKKVFGAFVASAMLVVGLGVTAISAVVPANAAGEGWRQEGVAWMAPASGGVEVYRLYDPYTGLHHYTTDANERRVLNNTGWHDEGVAFHADVSGANVYRVYNKATRQHHYTLSASEKDGLVSQGWSYEGVAWHVSDSSSVPVYRAYKSASGEHLWTTNAQEYEKISGTAVSPNAVEALKRLTVSDYQAPGYDRDEFGESWADVDGNGCRTRDDILARDLTDITKLDDCRVSTGVLNDPYTGTTINFRRGTDGGNDGGVQIDHVVALSNAWKSGANTWTDQQRLEYANDPYVLLAVDDQENLDKGDGAADEWLPSNVAYHCDYVARQIGIKTKYKLSVTNSEYQAMADVLASCPTEMIPVGVGSPTVSDVTPSTPSQPSTPSKPSDNVQQGITPGAFCSPEGAKGIGKSNGVTYTCKRDNNGILRWRR